MRAVVLLLLMGLSACNSESPSVTSGAQTTKHFPRTDVIAALNLLTAITDWPKETEALQKTYNLTPEKAYKLILPLHPMWDEKLTEAAMEMKDWKGDSFRDLTKICVTDCSCNFYQQSLDKHRDVVEVGSAELKEFANAAFPNSKETTLACVNKPISLGAILQYLSEQSKDYEAASGL